MDIPRLHPNTTEEVRQRADIVDVVSEYVVLRKRGKDYLGLCPFHDEKTPSFSVSPSKQLYHCFGCGAGGNVIGFLMEIQQHSFTDVVLNLAKRYQIPIQTLEPEQRQELQRQLSLREQLYEILAVTASFFSHALRQPQGKVALDYLRHDRELSEETIQEFELGYAPAGWETLYRYLVEQKLYSVELVKQAGLIKERSSGNGYIDRFRDRVVIPIHDTQGHIIGFGSRTLSGEEPKYLNSPETELFDKGKTLFALDKARKEISSQDSAVVVEGYFDAIALHAAGIQNAVASLGTAFSQDQLKQLLRYSESKQVILNFDADAAGTKATQRAIQEVEHLVYSGQVQLRVLNLPGGKDADEYLKSSPDAVEKYRQQLLEAPLWLTWRLDQSFHQHNLQDASERQRVAKEAIQLLNKIGDHEMRHYYVRYCAERLSQGQDNLVPDYAKRFLAYLKKPELRKEAQSEDREIDLPSHPEERSTEEAEALLLRVYIHCPEYRQDIFDSLEEKDLLFTLPHYRFLWRNILEITQVDFYIHPNDLITRLQDLGVEFPQQMAKVSHLFHLDEKQVHDIVREPLVIRSAIATLERVTLVQQKRYCKSIIESFNRVDPATNLERYSYYSQELQTIYQSLEKLKEERCPKLSDIVRYSPAEV